MKERAPEYETITPITGYSASFVASQGYHIELVRKNKDRLNDTFYIWTDTGKQWYRKRFEFYEFCRKGNRLLKWSKRKTKFKRDYKQ